MLSRLTSISFNAASIMTTDPGDLVLDPTCGSGTTATVAEQWGRRWITIDTSRVALALARARVMGARYPYYLLADSRDGQVKEAEVTRSAVSTKPAHGNIRHGFVYERVPHITLKAIANNRRDRRDLGEMAADARTTPRFAQQGD
jgi:adenine-specific DNA-methyltransferase